MASFKGIYRKKKLAWLVMLLILLINCKPEKKPGQGNIINIGSHHLHYFSRGIGYPAVILDVGFAESYRDWLPLLQKISLKTRVLAYDRAGYGNSDTGLFPRNSYQTAIELKKLLVTAEINGPYILLGHSLGALNLQLFAHKNKADIVGMVLLDPPPLTWILGNGFSELRQMAEKQAGSLKLAAASLKNSDNSNERFKAKHYETLASEHREMFSSSARQVEAIESFGDIPLIVIGSGFANPVFGKNAVPFQQFWNDQCRNLAAKSTQGVFILAKKSSDHIHRDNPELVLNSIFQLLTAAR